MKHFVSLVKINILDQLTIEERSLMHTKMSKRPSMLYCGAPDITSRYLGRQSLIETH